MVNRSCQIISREKYEKRRENMVGKVADAVRAGPEVSRGLLTCSPKIRTDKGDDLK